METLPGPGDIKPGWTNGVIELLNPVELGWRVISKEALRQSGVEEPEAEDD